MDSLTHTVLGVCIGELIAGKKIGRKAMIIGAIANNLPDIDVITSLWMSQSDGLMAHRGFTHSFLFFVILSPLLSYLAQKYLRKINLTFLDWLWLVGSGLLVHIFIDAFTTYGTGWFEPFNHKRVSFNTLFILEPVILIVLMVSAIALMVLKNNPEKRYAWSCAAITICSLYLTGAVIIKIFVDNKIERNIVSQHLSVEKYMASPAPLSNLLWYVIIKSEKGYYTGYYSLFDREGPIDFEFFNRNDSLIAKVEYNRELQTLLQFSNGYYCFTQNGDTIVFNDMRFGQVKGWAQKQAPFIFQFYLNKSLNNDLVIQRGRMQNVTIDAFTSLFARIKGNGG